MYEVRFSNSSKKYLTNIKNKEIKERILKSISSLKLNPFPKGNFKHLENRVKEFRIRVGKYRIIYSVYNKELLILIIDIDKRSRIYKN